MSNYQRLISYIYTYESGLKGKNVGFAKLETRNSQCRLTVNVKKVVPVGSPLGVYLLSGDGEQRIGTLFSRNGAGEFRALLNADRVEGSGRPLQEFFGLSIHEAENAGHSYTTIWEDVAMNAAEAAKEEEKDTGRSREKLQRRQEEEWADQAEESGSGSRREEALEKQEKAAEPSEKEELKTEEENAEAEEEKIKTEEDKTTVKENQSRGKQEEAEEETERETEQKVQWEKEEEQAEKTKRVAAETVQAASEREEKADAAGAQEKSSIRERLLCQNTLPPSRTFSFPAPPETGAGTEAIKEVRTERRSARPRSRRRPDGGMSAREWAEKLAAPRGVNQDCKAETPIKADDRAFIPLHELDDGCSHQRMWARLRRKYPKILAFDYEPGCEILTIKPQDIGLLPREAWIFGNNSFLLHGYYSYRYLILARLENPDGEPRYLLGVPGHYSSNEKYLASMFGFADFIMSKKQPSGDDCFGYWYTDVRVGN